MSKPGKIIAALASKKVHKLLLLLPLLVLMFGTEGCKARKAAGGFPRKYTDADFVVKQLEENRVTFDWMSARMKISFDDGKQNLTSSAHLRMRKDSVIWISVTPVLGIEALRILVKSDSVHVLNRLDKTYSVYPISIAKKYTGTDEVNFQTFQDALIGNSIIPLTSDFKASIAEEIFILLEKITEFEKESLTVSPELFRTLSTQIVRSRQNQVATIAYADHKAVDGRQLPYKIAVTVTAPIKVNLAVDYSKITLNQPESINFQVPSSYERN